MRSPLLAHHGQKVKLRAKRNSGPAVSFKSERTYGVLKRLPVPKDQGTALPGLPYTAVPRSKCGLMSLIPAVWPLPPILLVGSTAIAS